MKKVIMVTCDVFLAPDEKDIGVNNIPLNNKYGHNQNEDLVDETDNGRSDKSMRFVPDNAG